MKSFKNIVGFFSLCLMGILLFAGCSNSQVENEDHDQVENKIKYKTILYVGNSMLPTFTNGQNVYYYSSETYSNDDIVIVEGEYVNGNSKILKRIIGSSI